VGGGTSERTKEGFRRKFSSLPDVEMVGHVPRRDVIELMKKAQCLIFPSAWYEGFPMVIAEAFSCGIPVIASNLGSMAEIIAEGVTGLLYTPGDHSDLARKVRWARDHPAQLREMGRNARREFENRYGAERNYALLMQAYDRAIIAAGVRYGT
jgi:glycosyltransferase involved in cell wall biosynthesis